MVIWSETSYIPPILAVTRQLEAELTERYGDRWRLRIEREAPRMWRCHWDILTEVGEVLGGGSESFSISL